MDDISDRDGGFTVIEILVSMIVLGVIMSVLSVAVTASLRTAPDTETRLDDARATRSLATWLANDTTSTPPFLNEEVAAVPQVQGGMIVETAPTANNNDCNMAGENLLHLQWTEVTTDTLTFVSNYRFVVGSVEATIVRTLCVSTNSAAPVIITSRVITSGLRTTQAPTVTPTVDSGTGLVESIEFSLVGATGETVLVETGSRNPSDFFP